jgi:hypothetical protein
VPMASHALGARLPRRLSCSAGGYRNYGDARGIDPMPGLAHSARQILSKLNPASQERGASLLGGGSQGATKAKPSVDGELTAPPGLWLLSEVGTLAASWLGPTSGGSSFFAE